MRLLGESLSMMMKTKFKENATERKQKIVFNVPKVISLFRAPNESSSRYFSLIFLRDFLTCPGTEKDTFSPALLLSFLSLSIYILGSFPSLSIIFGLLYCPLECGGRLVPLLSGISVWRT